MSGRTVITRRSTTRITSAAAVRLLLESERVCDPVAGLGRALSAAGAGPRDLLRMTYFLTDLADIGEVRTARDEFLGAVSRPASSLVQPGARVEIDALAIIGSR